MKTRLGLLAVIACFALLLFHPPSLVAQRDNAVALTGQVTSAEEGPMEGVLVSARRAGSTVTTTVVSDRQGRYQFPRARLEPGDYTLRIRAIGYELERAVTVPVREQHAATADLKLRKASDLAVAADERRMAREHARHRRAEGVGARLRALPHAGAGDTIAARCERSSSRSSNGWPATRRSSFPLMPQKTPAPRIGGGAVQAERQQEARRRQAEYLSSINLSAGPQWSYGFKTLPRPTGKATRVIYTEYDLPKRTRQPHDVIVDSAGMAWYASFGEQILGKLDPKTAKVTEYPIPLLKPAAPTGILGMRFDHDQNLWLGLQFQGGIAKFDKKTGEVPDVEPAAGVERRSRPDQSGEPGSASHRRQGLAAGCRHLHGPAARRRDRHVRGLRAVQDPAPQRLRRDSRFQEQRLLPGDGRGGRREDRRARPGRSRSTRRRRRGQGRGAG